jgi:hypothetical protein
MFEFVDRVWHFLFRSRIDESIDRIAGRLKFFQRVLLALLAGLAGVAVVTREHIAEAAGDAGYAIMAATQPNTLNLDSQTRQSLQGQLDSVRPRLASIARQWINEQQQPSSGFTWGISQLVSAAPIESAPFKDIYFEYLERDFDRNCGCYFYDRIPHTITIDWVLLSYGALNERPPLALILTLLNAQDERGWWSVALDATADDANGSTHATVLSVLALQELKDKDLIDGEARIAASAAISRGQSWLSGNLRGGWEEASDYPDSERRNRERSFGAMSAAALVGSQLGSGFEAAPDTRASPAPNMSISSDAFVRRRDGSVYIDRYRHIPFAWMPAGLVASYDTADFSDRIEIRRSLATALSHDISDPEVVREEWMVAEIVFAQALILRDAQRAPAVRAD